MNVPCSGGWIEVIAGVMFSGKSEELWRHVRRAWIARKRVQVFTPHLDSRYAGRYAVSSHDGRTVTWDSPTILVGGRETYEARCRACHVTRPADEAQRALC